MYSTISNIFQPFQNGDIAEMQLNGTYSVYMLEKKLASYYHKKYCLLLSNATMGLYATALFLSSKQFHFIAPAFGWSGSIAGMLHFGNSVSFADVDDSFCLDPNKIEDLILPETKVIISIDSGGKACDSKTISEVAKSHNLLYISDSAESLGALRDNIPAGAFADIIIVSFTAGKTINAGEMGAVLTDDSEIYKELIMLTQHSHRQKKVLGTTNWYPFSPLNGRVHPLSAIYVDKKFDDLNKIITRRQNKAMQIISNLNISNIIELPNFIKKESTFFIF